MNTDSQVSGKFTGGILQMSIFGFTEHSIEYVHNNFILIRYCCVNQIISIFVTVHFSNNSNAHVTN